MMLYDIFGYNEAWNLTNEMYSCTELHDMGTGNYLAHNVNDDGHSYYWQNGRWNQGLPSVISDREEAKPFQLATGAVIEKPRDYNGCGIDAKRAFLPRIDGFDAIPVKVYDQDFKKNAAYVYLVEYKQWLYVRASALQWQ